MEVEMEMDDDDGEPPAPGTEEDGGGGGGGGGRLALPVVPARVGGDTGKHRPLVGRRTLYLRRGCIYVVKVQKEMTAQHR